MAVAFTAVQLFCQLFRPQVRASGLSAKMRQKVSLHSVQAKASLRQLAIELPNAFAVYIRVWLTCVFFTRLIVCVVGVSYNKVRTNNVKNYGTFS